MAKPIVAIVGRPNVGKSTLFNRLAGARISIVEDTPGVTRDRVFADAEWTGHNFTLIDTGGLDPESDDEMLKAMFRQTELAIEMADVIIFLVDVKTGVTDADDQVADMLRKSGKPVVLAVNKVDEMRRENPDVYEFYSLGLPSEVFAVSSGQALGLGDLLDAVVRYFDKAGTSDEDDEYIRVAVIGRPNAGKSSIINRILGEERLIVSDAPGTTRDAVDTCYEKDGKRYIFIDTAGIRRKSKIRENIERYSIVRAVAAIERADICVLVVDAAEGITEQDAKIAGVAHERGKAMIVAVNKWDLIEKDDKTMNRFQKDIAERLSYMQYALMVFISARTGQRLSRLFDMIDIAAQNACMRVATGVLNEVLTEAVAMTQPPSDKGRQLRIYYMTQVSVKPPTFVLFVNDAELFHFSYRRYIENQLRVAFGFKGTPIHFIVRNKSESD